MWQPGRSFCWAGLLLAALGPGAGAGGEVIHRRAKPTLTAVEINRGDTLKFTLRNGAVRTLVLEDTRAAILERVVPGGIVYGFRCRLRIDGHPITLQRYVCCQEAFYEPYVINGLRIWPDIVRDVFDLIPIRYPRRGNLRCLPRKDARFALQDAGLSICPQETGPWHPDPRNFIDCRDNYNGDDCYLGPYLGRACHVGLDINHRKGEPLTAPIDFDDHWLFNSVAAGQNNNRWRGVRRWPNGDVWALQSHHLIKLLVPEHTPLRAGTTYATTAGVHVGSHEHTHYEFKIGYPGGLDAAGEPRRPAPPPGPIDFDDQSEAARRRPQVLHLDPWVFFRQTFEDRKTREGVIRAAMRAQGPVRTGQRVVFSSEGSRSGPGGGRLACWWTFGDGGSAAVAAPAYIFARPGVYPVTLVVDDGASRARCTRHVTVDGAPLRCPVVALTAPDEPAFRARPAGAMDVYGWPVRPMPDRLEFLARPSRPVPAAKTIRLENHGGGVLPDARPPGVSYSGKGGWLAVEVEGAGNRQRLRVRVNAAGLGPGDYRALVCVDCPGTVNSPQPFRAVLRVPRDPPGQRVTIDDRDAACYATPYFWVGHRFCRCPAGRRGFGGFYLTNGGRAAAGQFVRFTPDLRAGRYQVRLSDQTPFPPAAEFNVRVRHKSGETMVRLKPQESRAVGTFEFEEGADGWVQIEAGGSKGLVVADAVEFRPAAR